MASIENWVEFLIHLPFTLAVQLVAVPVPLVPLPLAARAMMPALPMNLARVAVQIAGLGVAFAYGNGPTAGVPTARSAVPAAVLVCGAAPTAAGIMRLDPTTIALVTPSNHIHLLFTSILRFGQPAGSIDSLNTSN